MPGKLVICPTPLGNLGDMSPRAVEALRQADTICAEDTRVTGKLLSSFEIEDKNLERLDENVIRDRTSDIVKRILEGETIVYCSDAGMPGVSDPGLYLVNAARNVNASVEVIPGPTAVTTAYVTSGTTCPNFYFGGFFPRKDAQRRLKLTELGQLDAALIFYESPNRLKDSLSVIAEIYPLREIAVCRELTKLHEEVVRGTSSSVADNFAFRESVKGEVVIVIEPASENEKELSLQNSQASAEVRARELLETGMRPKEVSQALSKEFLLSRNEAYTLVLEMHQQLKDNN